MLSVSTLGISNSDNGGSLVSGILPAVTFGSDWLSNEGTFKSGSPSTPNFVETPGNSNPLNLSDNDAMPNLSLKDAGNSSIGNDALRLLTADVSSADFSWSCGGRSSFVIFASTRDLSVSTLALIRFSFSFFQCSMLSSFWVNLLVGAFSLWRLSSAWLIFPTSKLTVSETESYELLSDAYWLAAYASIESSCCSPPVSNESSFCSLTVMRVSTGKTVFTKLSKDCP